MRSGLTVITGAGSWCRLREEKDVVSPYYCVAYGGRYYLLACQEKQRETGPERRMSIWRLDLMTEMECLGPGERALERNWVRAEITINYYKEFYLAVSSNLDSSPKKLLKSLDFGSFCSVFVEFYVGRGVGQLAAPHHDPHVEMCERVKE